MEPHFRMVSGQWTVRDPNGHRYLSGKDISTLYYRWKSLRDRNLMNFNKIEE